MALTEIADDLIREYLLYKGFNTTLKVFDSEVKNDKAKGYRVDKIMEQIHNAIAGYDLFGLKEYWNFLDRHLFSRLEQVYASSIYKLEISLFRLYVINLVQSGRRDKVNEFFERLSPKEQNTSDWKEWFVLPYTKNPEEHPLFAMYFTKQWQDTFFLSLHNFLSVVLSCLPKPTLLNYLEIQKEVGRLREENGKMKQQLLRLTEDTQSDADGMTLNSDPVTPTSTRMGPTSIDLMDDFFVISQDTVIEDKPEEGARKSQPIRSFIRNIGLPSSPILGKKAVSSSGISPDAGSSNSDLKSSTPPLPSGARKESSSSGSLNQLKPGFSVPEADVISESPSASPAQPPSALFPDETEGSYLQRKKSSSDLSDERGASALSDALPCFSSEQASVDIVQGAYLLLSQEEFSEHRSSLTHCRFSSVGQMVATADVDGVIKVWSLQPSPVTVATTINKAVLLSLEWISNSDRLLLLGNKSGTVRLFDVKAKKTLKEVTTESAYPRIVSLTSSPCGSKFVCSGAGRMRVGAGGLDLNMPHSGRLSLWDLRTMQLERALTLSPGPVAVNCSAYSRDGQLLVTGGADGHIRVFDLRKNEACARWPAHKGEIYSVLFSPDERSCFSMGADGKFLQWSMDQTGLLLQNLPIHAGACGPFVLTGAGGYRQVQTPKDHLFAFDKDGGHVLTCAQNGGLIYQIGASIVFEPVLHLGGHRTPVVCVDWSNSLECKMCVTGSMDGRVKVSTLLSH